MAAYHFTPVWRNLSTGKDLSVDEMQLYVNYVLHPCVAVVVGPSIIVQRNRTTSEIIGAPTNSALTEREILEARLMDANANNDYAEAARLTAELAAKGTRLETKKVLRVHQDIYKNSIWLNKVCFEYIAESEQEVDVASFELAVSTKISLSIELLAKVSDFKPVPAATASPVRAPPSPIISLPRYPAPFSFSLVHMEIKPDVPYHILSASNLAFRITKKGTKKHDTAIMETEVASPDVCQMVSFVPQADNNWLILSWTKPEWALDVRGAKTAQDVRLHFWSNIHRKPNQQFKILRCPEGRAFIQAQHSLLWLKHQNKQIVQGSPINDDEAYHWAIIPAEPTHTPVAAGSSGFFSHVSAASNVSFC